MKHRWNIDDNYLEIDDIRNNISYLRNIISYSIYFHILFIYLSLISHLFYIYFTSMLHLFFFCCRSTLHLFCIYFASFGSARLFLQNSSKIDETRCWVSNTPKPQGVVGISGGRAEQPDLCRGFIIFRRRSSSQFLHVVQDTVAVVI